MRMIIVFSAIALSVFVAFLPYSDVSAQLMYLPVLQSSANDLIAEVNALRVVNGLPPYTVNPILMKVAQDQANYMAATGQVAHRPGLTQRILNAGYPLAGDLSLGGFRSENITGGNKTAAQAVQGWTGDALHTNTMLSPNLTEIGAGVAQVGNRYYMVIDCARPTTSGAPQAVTPNPDDLSTENLGPSDFIVPITTSTPDKDGMVYHEVQYGQTLWAIAIEYGVKIDQIRTLNNLGPSTDIYQGERLLVRKDAPPSPVTPITDLSPTPTTSIQTSTTTPFPTVTPLVTETPLVVVVTQDVSPASNSTAGMAIGIALVAILFAGLFSWISSRRAA